MVQITIHTRQVHSATVGTTYVGLLRIHISRPTGGDVRYSESTEIPRLAREDALADARRLRDVLLQRSHTA